MNREWSKCPKSTEDCDLNRPLICPALIELCYMQFNENWLEVTVKRIEEKE